MAGFGFSGLFCQILDSFGFFSWILDFGFLSDTGFYRVFIGLNELGNYHKLLKNLFGF